MNILVTGTNGFIGKHLLEDFRKQGLNAFPLKCRLPNYVEVSREIKDNKIDVIYHLAAKIPKGQPIDQKEFYRSNIEGTFDLLNAARENGVKKFIYSSSMAVYGLPETVPLDEGHPTNPFNIYGLTKLIGEQCCRMFEGCFDIIILRFSSVYGTGVTEPKATRIFAEQVLRGDNITIFGKGEAKNDYVYVRDILNALKMALNYQTKFDIFNIGAGHGLSTKELAAIITRLADTGSKISMVDKQELRPYDFIYNVGKAREKLGYRPTEPEQGLKLYLEDLKQLTNA